MHNFETNSFVPPALLKTAVLFLVFNRPDTTSKVFEEIRKAKPPRLYVAADGPREGREGEREKVEAVRKIATDVDWPCDIKTLFRDVNLGCKYSVSKAITWFFENEEQGIILEDDCVPSQSFFWFCEACLNKYRNDLRIWDVAGSNSFARYSSPVASSYCFSYYGGIWGWATWRDRWKQYDAELSHAKEMGLFGYAMGRLEEGELPDLRIEQFNRIIEGMDTWDYQWLYTRLSNSGLSVVPAVNLISNIGFGEDATHTSKANRHANRERFEMSFPLQPPPCIVRDRLRDLEYVRKFVRRPFHVKVKVSAVSFINRAFRILTPRLIEKNRK